MLNRRILRIKAFKVLYGYAVKGGMSLKETLAELDASCEATRDLYLYMLSIIPWLTDEASRRIEAAKSKLNPTEEEKNPNMKFVLSPMAALLRDDPDLGKLLSRKKLSWEPYDVFIRKVYDSMSGKAWFSSYMAAPGSSLAEDCKLFTKMFEEEFVDDDDLAQILEDINLWWIDDLAYSLTWCCRSLSDIARNGRWDMPALYQSDMILRRNPEADVQGDQAFVRKLLSNAYSGYDKYFEKVVSNVPDWDSDRLFSTDMALIALGLAEGETMGTPVPVVLNEYIEISKFYCPPKSRQFINGLLDKLLKENNKTE